MTAKFSLPEFIPTFWGSQFDGELKMWSLKTRRTSSYGSKDVTNLVRDVDERKHTEDLYFGLSTQPGDLGSNARGSNDSAILLPGIFADVDFAEAKDSAKRYPPDIVTALGLIHAFEERPFLIQHSGNGLHALYAFDEPLVMRNREDRRRAQAMLRAFNRRLASHFKSAGYEIDNVSDLARVFRVPTTFNHKSGTPKPVSVIEFDPARRLARAKLKEDLHASDSGPPKATATKLADHSTIQKECGWYGYYTGEGAATADEPNWYATASITARCREGDDTFHEYSARHRDYDRRESERKLTRAREEAGPRTCDAIRSELGNENFCDACPHLGSITSPIQLGASYDPGSIGPKPLGFTKEGHFALLDPVRKIVILASAQQLLAGQYLLGLAESGFWRNRFPGGKPGSTNYMAAGETLIKACRRAGPFDPLRVRGRGIWLERDKVIVNLGQTIESAKFLYLCFEAVSLDDGAPDFDAARLRDHLALYNWRNSQDADLVFGWLAMAPICGALTWRPHAFVYGPARSGKTTIHTVASVVLSPLAISADGQSTEAGIRQALGPDSLPVLLDEFESDHNGATLRNVLRLARSASSAETPRAEGNARRQGDELQPADDLLIQRHQSSRHVAG
jgi:hypothetical protein